MTTELVSAKTINRAALDVVREQLAPGANDAELEYFAHVANHLDLDPFRGQIVLIGRFDKRVNRQVFRPQITVDGRRAIASRTGELVGIEGPEWTGPRARGELNWQEVWDREDEHPYAARVFVWRKGWHKPANGTAKWSEMAQTGPLWEKMPAHMLGKVAESLALRRAFPETVGSAIVSVELDDLDAETPDAINPPAGGAETAREASTRPPAPSRDTQWLDSTPEQRARMRELREAFGLDGRKNTNDWYALMNRAPALVEAGKTIGVDDLDRYTTAVVLDFLEAEIVRFRGGADDDDDGPGEYVGND